MADNTDGIEIVNTAAEVDEPLPFEADPPAAEVFKPKGTLLDRTVCLSLNRRKWTNSRKASLAKIETIADKSLLSLSKRLLMSNELKGVGVVDREIQEFLEGICMPSMFKSGVYLVPIALVEAVETKLQDFKTRREAAVETFLEVYPDQVRAIEAQLADQFDATNYPTRGDMRAEFSIDWQYVVFGVPGNLKAIKASLFEDEKKKYAAKMQEAHDEYRNTLRARLLTCFDHLAESLKTNADGKKKKLYESTVTKLDDALKLFELQDATDDGELAAIVNRGRAIMRGVTVDVLRDDEAERARIEAELAGVMKDLKVITVDRSSRQIELPPEGEAV